MSLKTKKILQIGICISSKDEILEEIRKYLQNIKNQKSKIKNNGRNPFVIFTPNPEIITYAQRDMEFARIVNTAQINLPDGAGTVWAVKNIHKQKIDKIPGTDFMLDLVEFAQKQGLTIGLIGGKGKLADVTSECLQAQYPGLKIAVFDAPEIKISKIKNQKSKIHIKYKKNDMESEEKYFMDLSNDILKKKVDILFVALGHPKQEFFIKELKQQLTITNYQLPIILMSVGGAFDYISGKVPRAPLFIRNIGLEWVYRLVLEPWRLPRQLIGSEFFLRIAFPSLFPLQ